MRRDHAIIEKRVINFDNGGQPIICCWDTCDRRATSLYTHVYCEHDVNKGCQAADMVAIVNSGRTAHLNFVFCSHRHRAYFVNSGGWRAHESIERTGRAYGNLPAGLRGRRG